MSLSELFTYSDIIIENQGKAIETYLTYEIGLNFSKQIKSTQKISSVPAELVVGVAADVEDGGVSGCALLISPLSNKTLSC